MATNSAPVNARSSNPATPYVTPRAGLPSRRVLLASTAMLLVMRAASARTLTGGTGMPWRPFAGDPPQAVGPGPWVFFTPEEGAAVEALVDRLIPPDPETQLPGEGRHRRAGRSPFGAGIIGLFPRLSGAPVVQQSQATSLVRVVLEGSRAVATLARGGNPPPTLQPTQASVVLGPTGTMYDGNNADLRLRPDPNPYWAQLWAEPNAVGNASAVGAGSAGTLGGAQTGGAR